MGAYRLSYERKFGPIPEGLEPHHMCENPRCINPDHIEPLTHAENIRRSWGKLNWEKVREIRASDESSAALARRFGVSHVNVCDIRSGKLWREETRG